MLVKTTASGYVKDERSGLVVNQNLGEYELIKSRRRAAKAQGDVLRRLELLEARVAELEARTCR